MEKVPRRLGHATPDVTDHYYGHITRAGRPVKPLSFDEVIATERRMGGSWVGASPSVSVSAN